MKSLRVGALALLTLALASLSFSTHAEPPAERDTRDPLVRHAWSPSPVASAGWQDMLYVFENGTFMAFYESSLYCNKEGPIKELVFARAGHWSRKGGTLTFQVMQDVMARKSRCHCLPPEEITRTPCLIKVGELVSKTQTTTHTGRYQNNVPYEGDEEWRGPLLSVKGLGDFYPSHDATDNLKSAAVSLNQTGEGQRLPSAFLAVLRCKKGEKSVTCEEQAVTQKKASKNTAEHAP